MRFIRLLAPAILASLAVSAAQAADEDPPALLQNPCLAEDSSPRPCSKEDEEAYVQKLADQEAADFKRRHPGATAEHLKEVRRQTIELYWDSKTLREG